MSSAVACSRAMVALLVVAALFSGNCKFDASGIPVSGTRFEGCFAGPVWGGLELRLDHHSQDLLVGALYIGRGTQQVVWVLDGRATSDTKAELLASRAGQSGSQVETVVDLTKASDPANDRVVINMEDRAPAPPIDRCGGIL